jgi:5'-methylthioadenosine phosphorylase
MAHIGLITGSGFYAQAGVALEERRVATPFGAVTVAHGRAGAHLLTHVARHGRGHERLSHQVEHRANVWALHELAVGAIVASTAVGLLAADVPLGVPLLFDDLYFPSNRLPDGSLATFFTTPGDPRRGHWIPADPFSPAVRARLAGAARRAGIEAACGGCYAHADGPRFNTAAEHRALRAAGAAAVSQTCGPEAVLAGELGVPYALVGFGVNHVTGLGLPATGDAELSRLLARHAEVVGALVAAFLADLPAGATFPPDTGAVFRIEGGG